MNLENAYLRATVETIEQFEACLKSRVSRNDAENAEVENTSAQSADAVFLVYIDSGFFDPKDFRRLVEKAHSAGVLCGLRLPYIWRQKAEVFFDGHISEVMEAGFDVFLFRNTESLLYFEEKGLLNSAAEESLISEANRQRNSIANGQLTMGVPYVTDHSIYSFNSESPLMMAEMLPAGQSAITLPQELNSRELEKLAKAIRNNAANAAASGDNSGVISEPELEKNSKPEKTEMVVYGRAPMMVSAQCINKTVNGCDRRGRVLELKDRTGAMMPVKNCCRFCYNLIYNAVPTVLYDQTAELAKIRPDYLRYEFTVESGAEVTAILDGAGAMAMLGGTGAMAMFGMAGTTSMTGRAGATSMIGRAGATSVRGRAGATSVRGRADSIGSKMPLTRGHFKRGV